MMYKQFGERRLWRVLPRPAGQPVTRSHRLDAAGFTARTEQRISRQRNVPDLACTAVRAVVKIAVDPQTVAHPGAKIKPDGDIRQRTLLR
ncbi:hypothetical protein D3C73_1318410 [compost metagenome]